MERRKRMKPEYVYPIDNDNYVYALCRCELPIGYAIKMKKKKGQTIYRFECDNCETCGEIILPIDDALTKKEKEYLV